MASLLVDPTIRFRPAGSVLSSVLICADRPAAQCRAAFFGYMGTYLQLFLNRAAGTSPGAAEDPAAFAGAAAAVAAAEPMTLTAVFSSKQRWWRRFWTELKSAESNYPGLRPLRFEFDDQSHGPAAAAAAASIVPGRARAGLVAEPSAFERQYQLFEEYLLAARDSLQASVGPRTRAVRRSP